jgi:hypothetical protein
MAERVVFSFSLYGSNPKYTHGALANAHIIAHRFPAARMFVYIAESVPADIVASFAPMSHVRIIPVPTRPGAQGMFDRYLAIDSSDCDVMIVRDADSRIHDRDAACIEDFLAAPDKLIQIIRDHYHHRSRIMGGTVSLRKAAMREPMHDLILRSADYGTVYGADQQFLEREFYQRLKEESQAQIYDRFAYCESPALLTPFRVPIRDHLFVGQVHLFREDGSEYVEFDAFGRGRL